MGKTRTEDAGDYGGTCDTCANGVAKAGHQQCPTCEKRYEEVEVSIDGGARDAAIERAQRDIETITAKANRLIENWNAVVVLKSPCGHWMAHSRAIDGEIDCLECRLAEAQQRIADLDAQAKDLEKLLVEFIDDAAYARARGDDGLRDEYQSCIQCGSVKRQPHKPDCVVGRSEALLAHLEA